MARISTSVFSPLTSRFLSAVTSPLAQSWPYVSQAVLPAWEHMGNCFPGVPPVARAYSSPSVFADDPVNGHLRHFLGVAELPATQPHPGRTTASLVRDNLFLQRAGLPGS